MNNDNDNDNDDEIKEATNEALINRLITRFSSITNESQQSQSLTRPNSVSPSTSIRSNQRLFNDVALRFINEMQQEYGNYSNDKQKNDNDEQMKNDDNDDAKKFHHEKTSNEYILNLIAPPAPSFSAPNQTTNISSDNTQSTKRK